MRATRFRGTSPPSPRDAVCGLWRRPLYYSAGFAHALFTGVGYEYSFFQSKKNCQTARKEEKK
jgi:hypothetical protein